MNLDLTYKFLKYIALVIIIYFGLKYSCNSNEDNIDLMIFALSIVVVYAIIENMQSLFNSSSSNSSCNSDTCNVENFTATDNDIDQKLSKFFETSLDEIKNIKNTNVDDYNELLSGYNETMNAKKDKKHENFTGDLTNTDDLMKNMANFFETNIDELSSLDESEFQELKNGYMETINNEKDNEEEIQPITSEEIKMKIPSEKEMKKSLFEGIKMILITKDEFNNKLAKSNTTTIANIIELKNLNINDYMNLVDNYFDPMSESDKIKEIIHLYPNLKKLAKIISNLDDKQIETLAKMSDGYHIDNKNKIMNTLKIIPSFELLKIVMNPLMLEKLENKSLVLSNNEQNFDAKDYKTTRLSILKDFISGTKMSKDKQYTKMLPFLTSLLKMETTGQMDDISSETVDMIKQEIEEGSLLPGIVSEEILNKFVGAEEIKQIASEEKETMEESMEESIEETSMEQSSMEEAQMEEAQMEESSMEESSMEESSMEESSSSEASDDSSPSEESMEDFVKRLKSKNLLTKSNDKLNEFKLTKNRFITNLLENEEKKPKFVVFNMDGKRAIYRKINDKKYIRDDSFPIDDLVLSKQDMVNLNNIGVDLDLLKNNDLEKLSFNIKNELKKQLAKKEKKDNMDNKDLSDKLELDLIKSQKELDNLEALEKIQKQKLELENKKQEIIKKKKDLDRPKAFSSVNIERGEMRSESGVMDNDMEYHDFNRLPLDDEIGNKEYEYGYSFLPPKNWYPAPVHPPLCVSNSSCPVCPLHSDSTVVDLKDFDKTRRITQPDNINTQYIIDKLNSGR